MEVTTMKTINMTIGNTDTVTKSFDTVEQAEGYILGKLRGTDRKTIDVFEWDSTGLGLSYWNFITKEQETYVLEY